MNAGKLNAPPKTERSPSTTSGPVMIQGASCRCSASLAPVRLAPRKVIVMRRAMYTAVQRAAASPATQNR